MSFYHTPSSLAAEMLTNATSAPARTAAVVRTYGPRLEETMKSLIPVDTGETRDSVETTYSSGRTKPWYAVEVGPTNRDEKGRPIGMFLDLGTIRSAPRPFVIPTAEAHELDFVDEVVREIGGG